MKKEFKIIVIVTFYLFLFSCSNSETRVKNEITTVKKEKLNTIIDSEKYLSQKTLYEFVKNIDTLDIQKKYQVPFDTIDFNKVIAYDFDGREERYPSVINSRNGLFAPVVIRQKELNLKQIDYLLDFITDNKTYGESTAACFIPHLSFVFFKGKKRKYVIDICLDCNYLISTSEIPATQHKKMTFEDGTSYGLRGFSRYGKNSIVELSKELELD